MTDGADMDDLITLHPGGVFLRREALELGYDDDALTSAVRAGQLRRIRHGAYVDATAWAAAGRVARHGVHAQAVLLSHQPGAIALSHTTAALEHGLSTWRPDLGRIHVTRLDGGPARTHGDVVYHAGRLSPDDVVPTTHGLAVAPARAAVEHAGMSSVEEGLVVLDSALHLGLASLEDLHAVHAAMRRWPGTARLEVTLRLTQHGAESVGESRGRYLCWREHLPRPVLQFEVRTPDGHLVGRCDFAWPDHGLLGEFDGRVKYGRLLRPGQDPGDAVFEEKKREDLIRELTGWAMIRLVWGDLSDPRGTAARIRTMLDRRTPLPRVP